MLRTKEANNIRATSREATEEMGKGLHYGMSGELELELHAKDRRAKCDRCEEMKAKREERERASDDFRRIAPNFV